MSEQVKSKWIDSSKIGFMLHWGTATANEQIALEQHYEKWLPQYREVTEFEQTVGEHTYKYTHIPGWDNAIEAVDLRKWILEAKKIRADYITLACFHSINGYVRVWHSPIPGFPMTKRDLLGELITLAHQENIRVVLYITPTPNYIREDYYHYCRPEEYIRYVKNTPEKREYAESRNHGSALTEAQWESSFHILNNSYGFGAFTFDEIQYLMEHYELDGFWFDSYNNPVWFPVGEVPKKWQPHFVYDSCKCENGKLCGYHAGEYGKPGVFTKCTNPAHKYVAYTEKAFQKNYFYRRDILQFIRERNSDLVTFVNYFPPLINADIYSKETYCFHDEYRFPVENEAYRELLFVTGSVNSPVPQKPEWWYTGESFIVNRKIELKRILYTVLSGAIATVAQGPDVEGREWPLYMGQFNDFLEDFNRFAAESYLEPAKEGIRYVHLMEIPEDRQIFLEGQNGCTEKITALTPSGEVPLSFYEKPDGIEVVVTDFSVVETYGVLILKQYKVTN